MYFKTTLEVPLPFPLLGAGLDLFRRCVGFQGHGITETFLHIVFQHASGRGQKILTNTCLIETSKALLSGKFGL